MGRSVCFLFLCSWLCFFFVIHTLAFSSSLSSSAALFLCFLFAVMIQPLLWLLLILSILSSMCSLLEPLPHAFLRLFLFLSFLPFLHPFCRDDQTAVVAAADYFDSFLHVVSSYVFFLDLGLFDDPHSLLYDLFLLVFLLFLSSCFQ